MKHAWNPETWRCARCNEPFCETERNLPCRPDDSASFVANLADPPCDTELPDADA